MRSRRTTLTVALLACALTGVTIPTRAADSFGFTTIDVPGAAETTAYAINSAGQIVGSWTTKQGIFWPGDVDGPVHGYVRSASGAFTKFDGPDAYHTFPTGINSAGQIVGSFRDASLKDHGFIRSASGTITKFEGPDASSTNPTSINSGGQIVGSFNAGGKGHGFIRSVSGAFTTIDVPGATKTSVNGINDAGQIVGSFEMDGKEHSFIRSASGAFTTIDVPGATDTRASGINGAGQIVGSFTDAGGREHGFLRTADGTFTTFDAPGATDTRAYVINDAGQIVGNVEDPSGPLAMFTMTGFHGFLRRAEGVFTAIAVPGAIGNLALGINGLEQIVGYFQDAGYMKLHGFVTTR